MFPAFHTNLGLGGTLDSALFGIAQLLFDIAGLLWYVLLWIIKLATELNMLKSAAGAVDKIVGIVAQPISVAGIPLFLAWQSPQL